MSAPLAIGVDVGATKIAAALVNDRGEVLDEERAVTEPKSGASGVIVRIAAVARHLIDSAPAPVVGLGLGTPGYVDPVAGVVRNAVNLGWQELPLAAALHAHLDPAIGVWVDNDANVQALGEFHYGAAQGCTNFVYIGIGSGLGSGVLVDGRLIAGATFTAAEMGHLVLDPDGRLCACGLHGCVETVVSGPGILTSARELLAAGAAGDLLADSAHLTPEQVLATAQAGDPLACRVFADTARWLGIAFAAYVSILNPERIVIGGGMGRPAFDLLVPGAVAELRRRVPAQAYAELAVVPSQVMSSAVGASSLVWQARALGYA